MNDIDTTIDSTPSTDEPAITVGGIAGILAGALVLIVTRSNRSLDWLNSGELDSLKGLIALASPLVAAILIRRKVTPTSKVAAIVDNATQVASLTKEKEIHDFLNQGQADASARATARAPRAATRKTAARKARPGTSS